MTDASSSPWLLSFPSAADASVQVICFPHAGSGAGAYYPWSRLLRPDIAIRAVQLPGRQGRARETPVSDLHGILAPIREALLAMPDRRPLVLFGHSFGAVLAYETAKALMAEATPVVALVVSGRVAPHMPNRAPRLAHLSSRDLVYRVAEIYGGIPTAILAEADLVDLMGAAFKADLSILESYAVTPPEERPLTCPLVALAGTEDRFVSAEELDGWAQYTHGDFRRIQTSGGHFYLREPEGQEAVLGTLRRLCAPHQRRTTSVRK